MSPVSSHSMPRNLSTHGLVPPQTNSLTTSFPLSPNPHQCTNKHLAHYTFLKQLGQGRFCTVHLARHFYTEKLVSRPNHSPPPLLLLSHHPSIASSHDHGSFPLSYRSPFLFLAFLSKTTSIQRTALNRFDFFQPDNLSFFDYRIFATPCQPLLFIDDIVHCRDIQDRWEWVHHEGENEESS